jgi:hypothetical protein
MGEGTVQIHLLLREQNEEVSVDFPFNRLTDDMGRVVTDLIEVLGMAESETSQIRALVEAQVFGQSSAASNGNTPFFEPIDPPDDDCINDPRYFDLLLRQRAEIDQLKAKHIRERRKLSAELNAFSPPNPTPINSTNSTLVPAVPRVESPGFIEMGFGSPQAPSRPLAAAALASETVDDLIFF